MALQQIRDLRSKAGEECFWSSPSHPKDKGQSLMFAIEREAERLAKEKKTSQKKH
jgi:hypothetical protein